MSADYGTLCFDSVDFTALEQGVIPRFRCPICKSVFQPKHSLGTDFSAVFDYNQRVDFVIPTHDDPATAKQCGASGKKITLFIAVYKDANRMRICIQRGDLEGAGGITANWWQKP